MTELELEQEQEQELEELPQEEEEDVLDEMDLRVGMIVEVLTVRNILTFVGRVKAFNGEVLTIKESMDGELPPVVYNQEVKLRFFQRGKSLVLRGQICGSTEWIWRVDRLESQFGAEHRMFFRQNVDLKAQVAQVEEADPSGQTPPERVACRIMDVSVGGLQLSSRKPFEEGTRVRITEARIAKEMEPFTFVCRVQRMRQVGGNFLCGCKFEDLSVKEEDQLLQAIFIAQRKELHKQRDRG